MSKDTASFIEQPLSKQQQDFYSTMARHYEERAADRPDIPLLQEKARSMGAIAKAGHIRVDMMPDPNDLDVLL